MQINMWKDQVYFLTQKIINLPKFNTFFMKTYYIKSTMIIPKLLPKKLNYCTNELLVF